MLSPVRRSRTNPHQPRSLASTSFQRTSSPHHQPSPDSAKRGQGESSVSRKSVPFETPPAARPTIASGDCRLPAVAPTARTTPTTRTQVAWRSADEVSQPSGPGGLQGQHESSGRLESSARSDATVHPQTCDSGTMSSTFQHSLEAVLMSQCEQSTRSGRVLRVTANSHVPAATSTARTMGDRTIVEPRSTRLSSRAVRLGGWRSSWP